MKGKRTFLLSCVVLFLCMSLLVSPVAGTILISGETDYKGVEGDDEAIEVTTTISPEGEEMVDATVTFSGTDQTFLDPESFDVTISPGDADTEVSSVSNGEFEIDRLGPDEEVTFVFEVYPRTIKEESIDAATVHVQYTQSGQELEDEEVFTADMSDSAFFQLESQDDIQQAVGIVNIVGYVAIAIIVIRVVWLLIKRRTTDEDDTYY